MNQLRSKLLIRQIPASPHTRDQGISDYDLNQELLQGPQIEMYDLQELSISDSDSTFATTKLRSYVQVEDGSERPKGTKRSATSSNLSEVPRKRQKGHHTVHHNKRKEDRNN